MHLTKSKMHRSGNYFFTQNQGCLKSLFQAHVLVILVVGKSCAFNFKLDELSFVKLRKEKDELSDFYTSS